MKIKENAGPDRNAALQIIKALPLELREAIAVIVETSFVVSKPAETDRRDSCEDDASATLYAAAKEIRG